MANTFSGLTEFVNEQRFARLFWTDSLLSNDVTPYISQYGMMATGVKENKFTLQQLSATVAIEDGTGCSDDFDNGNDTTITQKVIELKVGRIKDSFCPRDDFETYYTALGMPQGQHYRDLGPWQGPLVNELMRKIGKRVGYNLVQGNQSGDSWTFDGLYDQLLAANMGTYNASSNPTGGIVSTGTITGDNNTSTSAYSICQNLIKAALTSRSVSGKDFAADIRDRNAHLIMNPLTAELLRTSYQALHGLAFPEVVPGLAGLQNDVQAPFTFPGWRIPIVIMNFLPDDVIILSRNGNAILATDLASDLTKMDMWLADDHQTVRLMMAFKLGVGWNELTGNAIKYHGPTT